MIDKHRTWARLVVFIFDAVVTSFAGYVGGAIFLCQQETALDLIFTYVWRS